MKTVSPFELRDNPFDLLDRQWMLISAGDEARSNTMTASWGGFGVLWNKPVATAYVRPTRFTYGLTEKFDRFSLAFLDEKYRSALRLCGRESGRDMDKWLAAGLTPVAAEGTVYPAEARMVMICRKLYWFDIDPANMLDPSVDRFYKNDYHRAYIAEIEKVLVRE